MISKVNMILTENNFMAIHPIIVEIFQSGPNLWADSNSIKQIVSDN